MFRYSSLIFILSLFVMSWCSTQYWWEKLMSYSWENNTWTISNSWVSSYIEESNKNIEVSKDIIFTLKDSAIKIKLILPPKLIIIPKINNRKIIIQKDPALSYKTKDLDDIWIKFIFWVENIYSWTIQFDPAQIYWQLFTKNEEYPVRNKRPFDYNIKLENDSVVLIQPWEVRYFTWYFWDFHSVLSWVTIQGPKLISEYTWKDSQYAWVFENKVIYTYQFQYIMPSWNLQEISWFDTLRNND